LADATALPTLADALVFSTLADATALPKLATKADAEVLFMFKSQKSPKYANTKKI
jgi:hypothetical protein